jgi:hypothetical protein
MSEPDIPPLATEELRLLADRERDAQRKRVERAAAAQARALAGDVPAAVKLPPMPASLRAIRKWLRDAFDLYEQGHRNVARLDQTRAHARAVADMFKASAEIRKAEAAIRSAAAQERLSEILAALEHGGATVALLASLRTADGLLAGPRRPLPRAVAPLPRAVAPPAEEPA